MSYLYLSKIFKNLNDKNLQEKNLNTVILLNPKNEEAVLNLVLLKIRKSNYEETKKLIKDFNFDYYQLYDVNPARTEEIKSKFKKKIITAINVSSKDDVIKYKGYTEISDIILFDSKGYHKSESFDHSLLDDVPSDLSKMIAGNIQIDDIPSFKNKDFIIDLSGSIENNEGKKDMNKIDRLLKLFANS